MTSPEEKVFYIENGRAFIRAHLEAVILDHLTMLDEASIRTGEHNVVEPCYKEFEEMKGQLVELLETHFDDVRNRLLETEEDATPRFDA